MELFFITNSLIFGTLAAIVSKSRNRNPALWFFIGAVFSVFGFVLLFLLKKVRHLKSDKENISQITYSNRCPKCNEYVKMHDNICPQCGYVLSSFSLSTKSTEPVKDDSSGLEFEDDFLTCPGCRVVNPIENITCHSCGTSLVNVNSRHLVSSS